MPAAQQAPPPPDLGPTGRAATGRPAELTRDKRTGRVISRRYTVECPFDYYAMQGQITELQHRAGIRMRRLVELAQPLRLATSDPSRPPGRGRAGSQATAEQVDGAREELRAALDHLSPEHQNLVITVAYGYWAGEVRGIGPGPVLQLRDALHALVKWWRIT